MIDSKQHLTNQWSDAPTGSWMQVEIWLRGNMNQEQAKERKSQNKRRLVLHLKVGMVRRFPLCETELFNTNLLK